MRESQVVKELRALQEKMEEEEMEQRIPCIEKSYVSGFFGVAILLNAVCIGLDAELSRINGEPYLIMVVLESLFLAIFWVEIMLRINAYGLAFWFDPWGPFDFSITLLGSLDNWVLTWALDESSLEGLAVLRTLRLLRLSRLLRTLRFFDQLALLARVLADAAKAIMWQMLLLGIVLYVSSVFVMLMLADEKDSENVKLAALVEGLPQLFYYHTYLVTAEGYIETLIDATSHLAFPWTVYWCFMVAVCNVFMANLMVGVVVDTHRNLKASDKDQLPDFLSESELFEKTLRIAFNMIDVADTGKLNQVQLNYILDSEVLREVFKACGIQIGIPRQFLKSLFGFSRGGSSDESITFEDFFDTCVKLCGSVQHIQLLMMQYDVSVLQAEVRECVETFDRSASEGPPEPLRTRWAKKPSASSLSSQRGASLSSSTRLPSFEDNLEQGRMSMPGNRRGPRAQFSDLPDASDELYMLMSNLSPALQEQDEEPLPPDCIAADCQAASQACCVPVFHDASLEKVVSGVNEAEVLQDQLLLLLHHLKESVLGPVREGPRCLAGHLLQERMMAGRGMYAKGEDYTCGNCGGCGRFSCCECGYQLCERCSLLQLKQSILNAGR